MTAQTLIRHAGRWPSGARTSPASVKGQKFDGGLNRPSDVEAYEQKALA